MAPVRTSSIVGLMTASDGTGGASIDLNSLVEALDRRARQAGTDGATNVVRGMVATITEVLGGLEDRLERIEGAVSEAGRAGAVELRGSLAGMHDRLGRLEDAFVQAVESSTESSTAMVGEIRDAVREAVASAVPEPAPPAPPSPAPDMSGVERQLGAVTERVAAIDNAEVMAGIGSLADVVRGLEGRVERTSRLDDEAAASERRAVRESLAAVQTELARLSARLGNDDRESQALAAIAELRTAWETGSDRVDRVLGAVRATLEERADEAAGDVPTGSQLRELQAAIERASRDDSAGRAIGLVEARLSAGLEAMVQRAETAVDASQAVRHAVEAATGRIAEMTHAVEDLAAAVESLGARVERETATAIESIGGHIVDRLGGIADQQARDTVDTRDALTGSLRREAELLTQRIAALAKAMETMTATLDDHVRRTENTFGRRAGEVGRKLAVDFGLRPRKDDEPAPARELGRGD